MKTIFILAIITSLISLSIISNEVSAFKVTPLNLFNEHELILIGKVISATPISPFVTQYDVKVEQYVKNPKSYDMITVRGGGVKDSNYQDPKTDTIFEEGNRVLLYLNKKDDWYVVSGYSFSAPLDCDAHQLLGLGTFPGEPLARGHPEEFKPDKHCISPRMAVPESIAILSPLKQFKSGTPAQAITCKQGLQSIMKINDGSPACVKPSTASRLIELGWGEPTIIIEKGWIDRS
jgi:hypothetical protein